MNQRWRPLARTDVTVAELDDDVVILDGDGQLHVLNPTAAAVWSRCDGNIAVAEIVTVLAAAFRTAPQPIAEDVTELLDRFLAVRLVS